MEIRPDHGLVKVGKGAPPGRGVRVGVGAWVGIPQLPPPRPRRPPRPPTSAPAQPGGVSAIKPLSGFGDVDHLIKGLMSF
jgi:hypothetical protein